MTTENNQKSNTMKLIGTLFSYGGRQASTGSLIATFVVSDPYEAGKNPDGTTRLEWNKVLEASIILPKDLADTLQWEAFQTKAGKAGMRARVSIYGDISIDRREPKPGERRQHRFWINPMVKNDQTMVFPLTRREAPAEKQPGDNTPTPAMAAKAAAAKATPATKIKAATASKAKKAVVTEIDANLPY